MLRIRIIGLAIGAVLALSAVASSSASAATLFLASTTGTLLDTNAGKGNHVFKTGSEGTAIECKKELSTGTVTSLDTKEQLEDVIYEECNAVTLLGEFPATVSLALYVFHAAGTVDIENEITITVPIAGCNVKVKKQNGLKSVTYSNIEPNTGHGDVELSANVSGISSLGSGGACGGTSTTGTYTGKSLVHLDGGEIKVD